MMELIFEDLVHADQRGFRPRSPARKQDVLNAGIDSAIIGACKSSSIFFGYLKGPISLATED